MNYPTAGQSCYVPFKEGATAFVPPRERLRYWESYTSLELVGLRCSSYVEEGLHARQKNFDLGAIRIADISGNAHVVERTMPIVRRHPKDSLFVCLLMEGDAFFYQHGRCTLVHSGDLIVYSTAKPYLYGFTGQMRQLMIDVKAEDLFDSNDAVSLDSPLRIDGGLRTGQLLTHPLQNKILDFMDDPLSSLAQSLTEEIRARLRLLLRPLVSGEHTSSDVATLRLLKAEQFIAENLCDPHLDAEAVARHMTMSLRNLNRIFETYEYSVTQLIWQERLALAYKQLADRTNISKSIGDVALGCGFSTQAHFAREFKQRYGITPTQHREAESAGRYNSNLHTRQ